MYNDLREPLRSLRRSHLMLSSPGSIAIKGQRSVKYVGEKQKDVDDWPPRFWKVQLDFRDDVHMAFCDARRWGSPSLNSAEARFRVAVRTVGTLQ